jgi:glycosyltransferase involved in cell wall biosynthesis
MKISIIVPVYNAEEYIEECIQSVIRQEYDDFELILVDDGSQDSSLKIMRYWAGKDKRIRVMSQKNAGQTVARFKGLRVAKGEYVWLIDADDKIAPGSLKWIAGEIRETGADVVVFEYFYWKNTHLSRKFIDSSFTGVYSGERLAEFYSKMIYPGRFFYFGVPAAMWNKCFRRELAVSNMKNVDPKIRVHEDGLTSFGALLEADKIAILPEALYIYRADNESMTRGFRDRSGNMRLVLQSLRGIASKYAEKYDISSQVDYYGLYQVWGMTVDLWVYKFGGYLKKRKYVKGLMRAPEVSEIRGRVASSGMGFLNKGFCLGFKFGSVNIMLVFAGLIAGKKWVRSKVKKG